MTFLKMKYDGKELAINDAMINNYASMDDGCSSWKWVSKSYGSMNDGLHENEIERTMPPQMM